MQTGLSRSRDRERPAVLDGGEEGQVESCATGCGTVCPKASRDLLATLSHNSCLSRALASGTVNLPSEDPSRSDDLWLVRHTLDLLELSSSQATVGLEVLPTLPLLLHSDIEQLLVRRTKLRKLDLLVAGLADKHDLSLMHALAIRRQDRPMCRVNDANFQDLSCAVTLVGRSPDIRQLCPGG